MSNRGDHWEKTLVSKNRKRYLDAIIIEDGWAVGKRGKWVLLKNGCYMLQKTLKSIKKEIPMDAGEVFLNDALMLTRTRPGSSFCYTFQTYSRGQLIGFGAAYCG